MWIPFSSRILSIMVALTRYSLYVSVTIFLSLSGMVFGLLPGFFRVISLPLYFLDSSLAHLVDIFCCLAIVQTPMSLLSTSFTIHFIFLLFSFLIRFCFTAELILFVERNLFRDKT